jgi:hypothetical protein
MKENLWKWRSEETKKKIYRKKETTRKDLEEKLEKLEEILEKKRLEEQERLEKKRKLLEKKKNLEEGWTERRQKESEKKMQNKTLEEEKKREKINKKKMLEDNWSMIRCLTVYLEENEDEWKRGQNDWLESKKISEWEIMSEEEKRKEVTKSTREENNTTPEMTPLSALRSTSGKPNTPPAKLQYEEKSTHMQLDPTTANGNQVGKIHKKPTAAQLDTAPQEKYTRVENNTTPEMTPLCKPNNPTAGLQYEEISTNKQLNSTPANDHQVGEMHEKTKAVRLDTTPKEKSTILKLTPANTQNQLEESIENSAITWPKLSPKPEATTPITKSTTLEITPKKPPPKSPRKSPQNSPRKRLEFDLEDTTSHPNHPPTECTSPGYK